MSPQEATALHVLAYVLLHNGQPDKAAVLLEAVDALRPGDTRTVLALATAHLRGGAAARALHAGRSGTAHREPAQSPSAQPAGPAC